MSIDPSFSSVPQLVIPAAAQRLIDQMQAPKRERCIEMLIAAGASRVVAERLADSGIHWKIA